MSDWKDTVMSDEEQDNCMPSEKQFKAYLSEPDDPVAASLSKSERRLVAAVILFGENIARTQAKITWKAREPEIAEAHRAGIKEVVDWSNETCPHDLFGEGTLNFKRVCDLCWQSKLKEWGLWQTKN